jgi:hypothetical protein
MSRTSPEPMIKYNHRLYESDVAKLHELAARWGGLEPMSINGAIREAIRRAHQAEFPPAKPTSKAKSK